MKSNNITNIVFALVIALYTINLNAAVRVNNTNDNTTSTGSGTNVHGSNDSPSSPSSGSMDRGHEDLGNNIIKEWLYHYGEKRANTYTSWHGLSRKSFNSLIGKFQYIEIEYEYAEATVSADDPDTTEDESTAEYTVPGINCSDGDIEEHTDTITYSGNVSIWDDLKEIFF